MTTCPTCGQLTDDNDDFVTFVSINRKRQLLAGGMTLPKPRVRYERRKVLFEEIPVVYVVDREEEHNDSIAEDHRLDRMSGMGDRRVEMVR